MPSVSSADGTTIAYDRSGEGPPVVVVAGAFCDRHSFTTLAALLAADFSVYLYDRRGRGDSSDARPVEVRREIEDLAAVLATAGAPAGVFGHSSGAVLALEASMSGLPVHGLAVYEPPYVVGGDRPRDLGLRADVDAALAAGRPGDAVRAFMSRTVNMAPEAIEGMSRSPYWPHLEALAGALPYDLALVGDQVIPEARLNGISGPTLALSGADSPAWARHAVEVVARAVPNARLLSVLGQTHQVSEVVLAPILRDFFGSAASDGTRT